MNNWYVKRMEQTSEKPGLVSVRQLAERLNLTRSALLKSLKARGVVLHNVRGTDTGFQSAKAITVEDAAAYEAWRNQSGAAFNSTPAAKVLAGSGTIYLVQPDPEARPDYLKIGWTQSPAGRFAEYRTLCPHLKVVRMWPAAQQAIEVAAIVAMKANADRQVGAELFSGDLAKVVAALDALFRIMGVEGLDA